MQRATFGQRLRLTGLSLPVFLFIYVPVAWLIISSIYSRADLLALPLRFIPANPTLQNYWNILS